MIPLSRYHLHVHVLFVARLQIPNLAHTGDVCVQFAYHMYGIDMGELSLFSNTVSGLKTIVWRKVGDQQNEWWTQEVDVTLSSTVSTVKPLACISKTNL